MELLLLGLEASWIVFFIPSLFLFHTLYYVFRKIGTNLKINSPLGEQLIWPHTILTFSVPWFQFFPKQFSSVFSKLLNAPFHTFSEIFFFLFSLFFKTAECTIQYVCPITFAPEWILTNPVFSWRKKTEAKYESGTKVTNNYNWPTP